MFGREYGYHNNEQTNEVDRDYYALFCYHNYD